MAKSSTVFTCQNCAATYSKWQGQCDSCGEWNVIAEEAAADATPKGLGAGKGRNIEFVPLDGASKSAPRLVTGVAEFDRVTGGGLVPGSAILVGGDPGIGKSTILLQVAGAISKKTACAYISGEEAVDQVRMRADRLGLADASVQLAAATNVRDIVATLDIADPPRLVIIDSIQTMYLDNLESAPGSVSQVRSTADTLIRLAKRRGFSLILVGHVTKEGTIAGPRVLEHMVDTVLYFEGERGHQFRLLRAIKNRFGPTDEIGVFEMTDAGLMQVENPSALFLAERRDDVAGAAVFAGIEGTRPVLVEIQALVALRPPPVRRAGQLSDGIPAVLRWCLPSLRRAAAYPLPGATSISMSPAASGSANRPPILRSPPHSSPPRWISRSLRIRSYSGKSAFPEKSGRSARPISASRRRPSSASKPPGRRRGAASVPKMTRPILLNCAFRRCESCRTW